MKNFVIILGIVAFCGQVCFGQSYQDYAWLTDCERLRGVFLPPDSTTLEFENCEESLPNLVLKKPNIIDWNYHTNDFVYFWSPFPIMTGCVTASGNYFIDNNVPIGTLQLPAPSITGAIFQDSCNVGDSVAYSPPFIFDTQINNSFIFDSQNGGIYLEEDSLLQQRIVLDSLDIKIQKAPKSLLNLFGPSTWTVSDTFAYPQNGAFYVEGDVFVSGLVNGDLTLGATGNIFIDNDLKYECTDSTGLNFQTYFCDDKLGLVSEMNVFLKTRHIATNKGFSWTNFDSTYAHNNHQEGVIINAGIIAFGESFGTFSANFPNFERFPNDPFGGLSNPNYPLLGNHGQVSLLGTLAQVRRGIVNSSVRGGFSGKLSTNGVNGPQIVLIYDSRFETSPPQNFPMKVTSVEEKGQIPKEFKLDQNYPNPFNPSTTINYELQITNYEKSKLVIFNILGEKVKEFNLTEQKGSVVWNGTNFSNKEVSSGVYFYRLESASGFSKVKKMVFLK